MGSLGSAALYWHTLRHLRPEQITGRLVFRFWRPRLSHEAEPEFRKARIFAVPVAEHPRRMLGPSRFCFLNAEGVCRSPRDWNHGSKEKLWLYNLHYFEDLTARDAKTRTDWHGALISRWIKENPPTTGVGWEPYPTSLRIGNWIKWRAAGNTPPNGFDRSLALQARWLRRRVEHHLLGNHLLANAKALVLAGLYFDGPEAENWRVHGLQLLERELPEQVLADGGHYERSPMYHALVLEDVLDLINAAVDTSSRVPGAMVAAWRETAARMLGWLDSVTHPDGKLPLLNDAAFGVAPTTRQLHAYAGRLRIQPSGGAKAGVSGYVRAERGPAVLICDVAPLGPDEQPGHGHADTLTFELSLYGERVIVDTGTSTYKAGPQRAFERSTAAHNTVEIDGCSSSEVWASFRVARRARLREVSVFERPGGVEIHASHDGYARLEGEPIHRRVWNLSENGVNITDRISGGGSTAIGRLLFHPSVKLSSERLLLLPAGQRCRWNINGASASIREAEWHPEFGLCRSTNQLHWTFDRCQAAVELEWAE